MIRTKNPQEMTISHLPLIPLRTSEFAVECDADGAFASVSYIDDNEKVIILGSALVVGGVAEIVFDEPITIPGELTLAVTGFNKATYLSTMFAGGDLEFPEPKSLSFTIENANHVVLTWEEPDGKILPVKGYKVYRNEELITLELVKMKLPLKILFLKMVIINMKLIIMNTSVSFLILPQELLPLRATG